MGPHKVFVRAGRLRKRKRKHVMIAAEEKRLCDVGAGAKE